MPYPYHSRKYSLNEGFFSFWSKNMAYVMGFWYADGNLQHIKSYRIRFYSKDLEHLLAVRHILGSNNPIWQKVRNGNIENCHYLVVHSMKMYKTLIQLGAIEGNKSTIIKFPVVPQRYLRDFIRGYFDGDGSVHKITYRATKNGKFYTEIRSNFTCGSKIFLEKLNEILNKKLGLAKKVIGQYGPHQFKLGYGQKDTAKLLDFMYYPGHSISLERKAAYLYKI